MSRIDDEGVKITDDPVDYSIAAFVQDKSEVLIVVDERKPTSPDVYIEYKPDDYNMIGSKLSEYFTSKMAWNTVFFCEFYVFFFEADNGPL